ncbi:MAG: hypothetical protein LUJ09_02080 [Firmicutes bacterium]|nr:hypothetical protein [Bacillota bacterium]
MAYRIDYTSGGRRMPIAPAAGHILAGFFLGLGTFCAVFALTHREALLSVLIPGDPAATAAAGKAMLDQLRQGQSVAGAVTAFCQSILSGANGS